MRDNVAALTTSRNKDGIVGAELIAVSGRNRSTNAINTAYFWNGFYSVDMQVVDGITGSTDTHTFVGSGPLISLGDLQYVAEQTITVRTLEAKMSGLHTDVVNQIRGYDLHEQSFQYWQADFDLGTRGLVTPAICFFAGYIDTVEIVTPAVGGTGEINISVRSVQSDMTRKNTLYRTHASEILRDSSDTFYEYTQDIKDWQVAWGQKKSPITS